MSSVPVSSNDMSSSIEDGKKNVSVDGKRKALVIEEEPDFNEESMPGDDDEDDTDENNEVEDDDGDDPDEDDKNDDNQETEIQVEFEAFSPEEIDFQGIQKLLKQLFLKENVDLNGLTDLIINKNSEYSLVIKQESEEDNEEEERDNDEEVYAITSFVQMDGSNFKCETPIENLAQYFMTRTEKCAEIQKILKSKSNVFWLVNERFINLSPKLSLPSFENILGDISKAKLAINYVIMIIKILKRETNEERNGSKSKKLKSEKLEIIYQNPEEELFDDNSDFNVEFSVASQCDEDARAGDYWDDEDTKYVPHRKILFFNKSSFDKAIECLRKELKK